MKRKTIVSSQSCDNDNHRRNNNSIYNDQRIEANKSDKKFATRLCTKLKAFLETCSFHEGHQNINSNPVHFSINGSNYCFITLGQNTRANGKKLCKNNKSQFPQPRSLIESKEFHNQFRKRAILWGVFLDMVLDGKGKV